MNFDFMHASLRIGQNRKFLNIKRTNPLLNGLVLLF